MAQEQVGEVVVDGVTYPIRIDFDSSHFEIRAGGEVAFILFRLRGSTLSLIHTEVPPALQRKGLADALAKAALEYARTHSMTVKPICPFVAKYLTRHPEYQNLVDAS
jgi:predicted GNAT family acetyltransferase